MDMPRELANMLGIVLDEKKPKPKLEPVTRINAICTSLEEGVITLTRDGAVMGWLNKITKPMPDGPKYRAVSIHGEVKHCYALETAKEFIFSQYQ
jgi:hypothetical protein